MFLFCDGYNIERNVLFGGLMKLFMRRGLTKCRGREEEGMKTENEKLWILLPLPPLLE